MPRFAKGSDEAKAHMAKIREARGKNPPNPNKKPTKRQAKLGEVVSVPLIGSQSVAVPEFFATPLKKGGFKLVNPLTKVRNVATRGGQKSIRLIRKPVENMILMEHSTEPIPLKAFSKKDRDTIDTHFKVVKTHSGKEPTAIPLSSAFTNKERGRPEKLPENIRIHMERGTKPNWSKKPKKAEAEEAEDSDSESEEEEEEEAPQPKTKGRKKKYATEEEKKEAKRKQNRESYHRVKAKKGEGIISGINNFIHKVIPSKKTIQDTTRDIGQTILGKKTTQKIEQYGDAVINGRNDYPPKVRDLINKYGDEVVVSGMIRRSPVQSALITALNVVSLGQFKKNLNDSPYDKLFHLQFAFTTQSGKKFVVEKNEVINMDINPSTPPKVETKDVMPIPSGLTIRTMMDATKEYMGGKMFGYSAKDNNCQDFIMGLLNGNHMGSEEDRAFTKQDTKSLFSGLTTLRKVSNTLTDLGAKANVITTGAGLDKDLITNKKNKISTNSIMPKFAKGSKEAKEYMASIRAKRGKGLCGGAMVKMPDGSIHPVGSDAIRPIGPNGIRRMTTTATGGTLKDTLKNKIWDKIPDQYHKPIEDIGRSALKDLGFGITIHQHHHHHYDGEGLYSGSGLYGGGMWDWADPKKNGVAKAFDPKQNGVADAFKPGGSAEQFGRQVGHYGIPALTGALGGLAGGVLGGIATGGAGGEFVGGVAGSALGSKAGNEINKAIGIGFKKGSPEAKAHMAKIRAMRKGKGLY